MEQGFTQIVSFGNDLIRALVEACTNARQLFAKTF